MVNFAELRAPAEIHWIMGNHEGYESLRQVLETTALPANLHWYPEYCLLEEHLFLHGDLLLLREPCVKRFWPSLPETPKSDQNRQAYEHAMKLHLHRAAAMLMQPQLLVRWMARHLPRLHPEAWAAARHIVTGHSHRPYLRFACGGKIMVEHRQRRAWHPVHAIDIYAGRRSMNPAAPTPSTVRDQDCYCARERGTMLLWQRVRAWTLAPLLRALTGLDIRAGHLTFVSLLAGLLAACLLPYRAEPALWLLLAHVMIDGIDGPLARHQQASSPQGSANDTFCDQLVVTAMTTALIAMGSLHSIGGILFIASYLLVVIFAMIRNAQNDPYDWVVRPRFALYLAIPVAFWGWPPVLEVVVWPCNVLLVYLSATGFTAIPRQSAQGNLSFQWNKENGAV